MSSSSNAIFNGASRYSSDFQAIIDRSVAIASLPLSQLNADKATRTEESAALTSLNTKFSALQTAVGTLDQVMASGSIGATLSDSNLSATVAQGALEGVYSVEVTDLGAYTTTLTSDAGPYKVTDPNTESISNLALPDFSLTVGTTSYSISPAHNTLSELVAAINAKTEANVRATMVNVGSSSAPDYRLSLQSSKLGDFGIQLSDGALDLQTEQVRGAVAKYKVNGSATAAESDSRTVSIAPGLSVNLLAQSDPGVATSITLTRQSSPISDALNSLVTAYNAAVDELDTQRGSADGALAGHRIVYDLADALQGMTSYFGSAAGVNSLAELGVTMDQTGHMLFTEMTFLAANFGDSAGVTNFLGGSATGGFLESATSALSMVADPFSGTLKSTIDSVQTEILHTDQRIAGQQTYVEALRTRLQEQLAASDALIASLEQQYTFMSQMFESMRAAQQMYQ